MATLPDLIQDPTLQAVDAAIEAKQARRPRDYLGMSAIGRTCDRQIWYSFRWCTQVAFDAATLKRFADGHDGETLQAARLRMVDGIELHTLDESGQQFGFYDLGGHLRGHMDGAILGLVQAPKTWHVWEHKQVDPKKQNALAKLKREKGEKAALALWDETYFGQAMLYMHYSGMTRHYLTCATPGGRETIGIRTEYDPVIALRLIVRAERIIASAEPFPRISEDPNHFVCRWCDHRAVCQEGAVPEVSCRTCVHATPEPDGDRRWSCALWKKDLTVTEQEAACDQHLFIPKLLPYMVADASTEENSVTYVTTHGEIKNGGLGGLDSRTIREMQNVCVSS